MSDRQDNNEGSSLPFQRAEPKFRGFPEFRSNVLYCPKQFFTVVIPHSSVNCIRLVAYMLRKTLGWVDERGEPIQEQHKFSHRELEDAANVSRSRLPEAIKEALNSGFIHCTEKAQIQVQGVRAKSGAYELCWDENRYTDALEDFHGFYLQPSYVDESGQNRLGRKNIPNIFFDYLIKNENRRLIRVVGTLLWYSIDWGKGGERKVTVRKSLRDLVELTRLERSNVVRALDEAEKRDYVERIERGVFDLSGTKQSSTTVYGIRWTSEFTYTHDGVPVAYPSERPQKATQPVLMHGPKKPHGLKIGMAPKSHTEIAGERPQKATQHGPKKPHGERPQKATIRITKSTISKTLNNNSTDNSPAPESAAAVLELVEILFQEGFSKTEAPAIIAEAALAGSPAGKTAKEVILCQVELLPTRAASKNKLGLLRAAIKGNWPAPEGMAKTTDVSSSLAKVFAAHFYAGYHGNSEAPVTDPSPADVSAADLFVKRLSTVQTAEQLSSLGRQFGELVAHRHKDKRQSFPALQPALRQFGDDFYTRLKVSLEAGRKNRIREAQASHFERFKASYRSYIVESLKRHEQEGSELSMEFSAKEEASLQTIRSNRFGLDTENLIRMHQAEASRLERFEAFFLLADSAHDVLDFWTWDQKLNAEPFNEEKL